MKNLTHFVKIVAVHHEIQSKVSYFIHVNITLACYAEYYFQYRFKLNLRLIEIAIQNQNYLGVLCQRIYKITILNYLFLFCYYSLLLPIVGTRVIIFDLHEYIFRNQIKINVIVVFVIKQFADNSLDYHDLFLFAFCSAKVKNFH